MKHQSPPYAPPAFFYSADLDARGPFKRERRRQLEVAGLFPPRIRISCRLNAWVREECLAFEVLLAAGVRGDAMRAAIAEMVSKRPTSNFGSAS